jgi:quercetin dioxygenase-like cupin family protein
MTEKTLLQRGTTLVRRLQLAPGEAMPWHRDPYHRVSVILSGDALEIEYRSGSPSAYISVAPGQVDWDEPSDRVHRAVNVGAALYEEITIFFLDRPDAVLQPRDDGESSRVIEDKCKSGELVKKGKLNA